MNSISSFVQVLKECDAASGNGSKAVIKDALTKLDLTGQTLFKYAMDPFLVFGVKKYAAPTTCAALDDATPFILLLDKLAARELTGNAARDAVTNTLSQYSFGAQSYLARVLAKDLDSGFSAETFNKVHPQNPVYIFDVQLADKCTEPEEFEQYIKFPCQADVKYDGERNVCIVTDTVVYHSRNGKIAEHMNGLFDEELQKIRTHLGYDFVLDGERMAKSYIETMNAKKSGKDGEEAKANMRFRAFFLMSLTDWIAKSTTITTRTNRENIIRILDTVKCQKIIVSEGREVQSYSDMVDYTNEVTSPGFNDMPNGQEGLILKDWDSTYEWDRSMAWCKVKKFFDADARILSWEFGKKKHAQVMGRVNVGGWLEDGTYFEAGVGSGWNDKQRKDIAENFDATWKGQTLVVKYQEVSKGKNKEHASLRFPTVDQEKLLRNDKTVPLKDNI